MRVAAHNVDDLAKLLGHLDYIRLTRTKGNVLRVDPTMVVKAYIDAAYGVHRDSGKSHTGRAVVLRDADPTFSKSAKQKVVIEFSAEAEITGLSDTAGQVLYLRNIIIAQGSHRTTSAALNVTGNPIHQLTIQSVLMS